MSTVVLTVISLLAGMLLSIPPGLLIAAHYDRKQEEKLARQADQLTESQRKIGQLETSLSAEQRKLRQQLRRDEQRRAPVNVQLPVPLGQPRVARPEVMAELFGSFFTSEFGAVVVSGDTGVGKTWVALEFANIAGAALQADHVSGRAAPFRDGLLCASLGENPDVFAQLKQWHEHVKGTNDRWPAEDPGESPSSVSPEPDQGVPSDEHKLAADIRVQLGLRRPLLIIDDVWDAEHARALVAASPESPVLMTTSLSTVVAGLAATGVAPARGQVVQIRLGGLTDRQERELLLRFAGMKMAVPATARAAERRDSFLSEIAPLVDNDPFSVVQSGALIRDLLQDPADAGDRRLTWTAVSQQTLDDIKRKLAGRRDEAAAASEVSEVQPDHRKPQNVYQVRLDGLHDPLQLALLRTLSLLRPRPEQFTAAEVAALVIPQLSPPGGPDWELAPPSGDDVRAALDKLADGIYLERTKVAEEFRVSVHNRARAILSAAVVDDTRQAFHQHAVAYWRPWIDPRDPDSHIEEASSYQLAQNLEGGDWLRPARNIIYHLRQLDGSGHLRNLDSRTLARQTFAAIYFELFYWWGVYARYDFIDQFVSDWEAEAPRHRRADPAQDAVDARWYSAIRAFHRGYLPGHSTEFSEDDLEWHPREPSYERDEYNWPAVTSALQTIRDTTGLGGPPDQLTEHDQWHTRALIDLLEADSLRFRPPPENRGNEAGIDQCHAEARALFERCNRYDETQHRAPACDWNLPWVDAQEADEALRRSRLPAGAAARQAEWRKVDDLTAAAIRGALAGGEDGKLTDERDGLDYELVATACLIRGDMTAERGDGIPAAAAWYADAIVLACTWLYRPSTDDYTRLFCGAVSEHTRRALDAAGRRASPAEVAAAVDTVLRDSAASHWGAGPGHGVLGQADLGDSTQFLRKVMGPWPRAGRHEDGTDPIPAALDQAAERVIARLWDAVQAPPAAAPAASATGPAA